MHLDEGRIQQWLDHEVLPAETEALQQHIAQCSKCSERLQKAEQSFRETADLLRHLDHTAPRVTALELLRPTRSARWSWVSKVAALFLVTLTVGGVAWAASDGALTAWVRGLLRPERNTPTGTAPATPAIAAPALAGVSVSPGARFSIRFSAAQAQGNVRITLTNGQDIVVRAPLGVATFTSGETTLSITNMNSTAVFEMEIPKSAPWVEIRVNGGQSFLKQGETVTGPRVSREGELYVVPLRAVLPTPP